MGEELRAMFWLQMKKRAYLLRCVTLALSAFFAVLACCVGALSRHESQGMPGSGQFLHFGQSLAVADFDGDARLDNATVDGTGRNKRLEIRLSNSQTRTVLLFDTLTSDHGSLFTSDVDNDGDNDLIWTDLIHPEDVVIWLDDGTGRFERVCPHQYAQAFVLSGAPAFDYPETAQQDLAFCSQHDPWPSLPLASKTYSLIPEKAIVRQFRDAPVTDCCLKTSIDRGPPSLLS